ncbi:MAG: hypothetical protein JWR83_1160 [Aeromicrobium sp.]|nr:hypothetical protein [Aeromicrobium sp.]
MRPASSPAARLFVAGVLTALTAPFLAAIPASAATPAAPGSFTGYGFDACVAPSQTVMDAWNQRSPYSAIGIYISGDSRYCGDKDQPNLSKAWVAKNASNGWRFIPIHVGRQAPCFKNNPNSKVQKYHMSKVVATARSQARIEGAEAVAALKKYGFGSGSTTYLDLEWYARTTACDNIVLEFTDAWTEYLHTKGYKSGVYSSGSAAIKAIDEARQAARKNYTLPDNLWIAWTNKQANTDGGAYLSDVGWANHQRIHQYDNGVDLTYGGHKLNIDRDFLDVGRGSVATKELLPCKVKLSFASYPTLKLGATGPEVAALQCLLHEQGLKGSVTDTFGTGTAAAIDAFRKKLGWAAAGHTTKQTWTALLSAGSTPHVLKRGSVGDPVWRLQRALVAAGEKITITGLYNPKTASAVQDYRDANGLARYVTTESTVWGLLHTGKIA